jgi:hypothetical protein
MCYTHDTEPIIQQIIAYQGWQTMHLWKIGLWRAAHRQDFRSPENAEIKGIMAENQTI